MATAQSLTSGERDCLSPEAERRLDSLLSFDNDADDHWDDWPYEHYPGEACPLVEHRTEGMTDAEWDAIFEDHEAYRESSQ